MTASRAEIGVYGPGARRRAGQGRADGRARPPALFTSTRARIAGADAILVRSDEAGVPGYDLIVDASAGGRRHRGAARGRRGPRDRRRRRAVRIESGRPRFGVDMDDRHDSARSRASRRARSRAAKGCYVGQEVIVRVQDRGHGRVAKRLVGLVFDPAAAVPAGRRAHRVRASARSAASRARPGRRQRDARSRSATCIATSSSPARGRSPAPARRPPSRGVADAQPLAASELVVRGRKLQRLQLVARDPAHLLSEQRHRRVEERARQEVQLDAAVRVVVRRR